MFKNQAERKLKEGRKEGRKERKKKNETIN
jgi:hypothetical protein